MDNELFQPALSQVLNRRNFRIFYAFLDQGLFSAGNFILNLLLARWLSGQAYGAFSVSFSFYIIASAFQGGLVLEPISVYGALQDPRDLSSYISRQFQFHLKINALIALLALVSVPFLPASLKGAFLGAALAIPFTFVIWFYRRVCYINLRTRLAVWISLVYALGLMAGLAALNVFHLVAPLTGFAVMALASLVSAAVFLPALKIKIQWSDLLRFDFRKDALARENWGYGKWILAAMISDSVLSLVYIPLIAWILDLNQAAGFRTMQNFLMPVQQLQAAVSLMVIPWLSRKVVEEKYNFSVKNIFWVGGFYLLPALIYSIPVMFFGTQLTSIIYKSEFYNSFVWMIPILLASSFFGSFNLSLAVLFRAVKFSKPLLWSKMSAALCTLILGSVFIFWLRMPGVLVSMYLGILVEGIVSLVMLRSIRNSFEQG